MSIYLFYAFAYLIFTMVTCFDSAVMLFIYWIANFVVPEFIMKDLQDESTNNNNKTDEKDIL